VGKKSATEVNNMVLYNFHSSQPDLISDIVIASSVVDIFTCIKIEWNEGPISSFSQHEMLSAA
jgi:hypothetical protein